MAGGINKRVLLLHRHDNKDECRTSSAFAFAMQGRRDEMPMRSHPGFFPSVAAWVVPVASRPSGRSFVPRLAAGAPCIYKFMHTSTYIDIAARSIYLQCTRLFFFCFVFGTT